MLKKFNVSNILQVESDRLTCISANAIMSLFVILSSLTVSSICFEKDRT